MLQIVTWNWNSTRKRLVFINRSQSSELSSSLQNAELQREMKETVATQLKQQNDFIQNQKI